MIPQRGDVVRIDRNCGLQFRFCDPFLFAVAAAEVPTHSPDGSVWLTGYEVDADRLAVEGGHQKIWVQNADALTPARLSQPDVLHRHPDGLRRYTSNSGPMVPRQRQASRPVARYANRGGDGR